MPDFLGVLTDGTVGGELGAGSDVQQALTAEVQPVSVVCIHLQLGIHVGSVVQQQEVVVSLVPGSAVQQSVEQLALIVVGRHGAIHQGVQSPAQSCVDLVDATGAVVGLDLGISSFAVSSDGIEYPNPKYLRRSEKKLARLQRQMSRKTKGSKNYEKARIRLARLHEHIANQRKDMQHKLSTELVRQYDVICVEGMQIQNLLKKSMFAKFIADFILIEFAKKKKKKN